MEGAVILSNIESSFRKQVRKDKKIKNAYLLIHSKKLNINLNIAEGSTEDAEANINQPNHLASVGKLFTATIISILYERGLLDFKDKIHKYLDDDLMKCLHIYKGRDYSDQITIRHLLMQTSGLNDVFYHLLKKFMNDPDFRTTPREGIIWGKENLKPVAVPGKRHFYTDTNYYLLGLIIESITGKSFHENIHEFIFNPLGMKYAYVNGFSRPLAESLYATAGLYIKGHNLLSIEGIHQIDYAGGSIIAPLSDYLIFMKALTDYMIIKKETLKKMIIDDIWMGFPTVAFKYGYSIWKNMTIPVILPRKYNSWGCVGATGAFLFYHSRTESIIIGTFNDFAYRGKALDFLFKKVIKELLRLIP